MKYVAIIALTTILAGLGATVAASAEPWRDRGDHGDRREPEYVDQPSITLFERPGFQGKSHTFRGDQSDLGDTNFNDHAASAQVRGRWRVCGDSKMRGRCEDLFRDAPDLKAIGMDHQISSLAYVGRRPEPPTPPMPPPMPVPPPSAGGDELLGRTAALFRRPATPYGPVPSRQSEADAFCRTVGYSLSLYADYSGPELRDLVCRR